MLGLEPDEDGFRTFTMSLPKAPEFGAVNGSVDCPHGTIAIVSQRLKERSTELDLNIPMSTPPSVLLPGTASLGAKKAG